jgi:low affinity Fe/Cu permease
MVLLIQSTQNSDRPALHLKLSDRDFAMKVAENSHAALENLSDVVSEQASVGEQALVSKRGLARLPPCGRPPRR